MGFLRAKKEGKTTVFFFFFFFFFLISYPPFSFSFQNNFVGKSVWGCCDWIQINFSSFFFFFFFPFLSLSFSHPSSLLDGLF